MATGQVRLHPVFQGAQFDSLSSVLLEPETRNQELVQAPSSQAQTLPRGAFWPSAGAGAPPVRGRSGESARGPPKSSASRPPRTRARSLGSSQENFGLVAALVSLLNSASPCLERCQCCRDFGIFAWARKDCTSLMVGSALRFPLSLPGTAPLSRAHLSCSCQLASWGGCEHWSLCTAARCSQQEQSHRHTITQLSPVSVVAA